MPCALSLPNQAIKNADKRLTLPLKIHSLPTVLTILALSWPPKVVDEEV